MDEFTLAPLPFDAPEPTPALVRAFEAFHAENPHVYRKLRELALEARRAGVEHLGIAVLFERLRWYSQVETTGDQYRLNNNFRALYARLLMQREPELREFFRLRPSVGDRLPAATAPTMEARS